MTHVTIIGSGIAAAAAAIESLARGADVTVIGGRSGATAMASGAWDIAANPLRHPRNFWHETPPPRQSLKELLRRYPQHPYSLMSLNDQTGGLENLLTNALERLSNQISVRLRGSMEQPFLALTPLGSPKVTAFVDPTHAAGNLLEMRAARLLILGLKGLPFSSSRIATLFRRLHARQAVRFCAEIFSTDITLKGLPAAMTPLELALRLDQDEMIERLQEALIRAATQCRATHVALLPVIGVEQSHHILARLAETSTPHWFEILGLPPSIPGLRLHRHLEAFFRNGRLSFLQGEATGAEIINRRILGLKIKTGQDPEEQIPVDRLILTTGKFLGGGLLPEGQSIVEPVLKLPVFTEVEKVAATFFAEQAFCAAGLRVGPNFQPVNEKGNPVYENLWAAGSILGGYNAATQGCGMGVAVGTGTLAGRLASQS